MSRYNGRLIAKNQTELYRNFLEERQQKFFRQYITPEMHHPTAEEISDLNIETRIWSIGDRYYKYAYEYYGDSDLWWIIAWFNQRPTEAHVSIGDVIEIPLPLDKILSILRT